MASAKAVIKKAEKEISRLEKLMKSGKEDPAYCIRQIGICRATIYRLRKEK